MRFKTSVKVGKFSDYLKGRDPLASSIFSIHPIPRLGFCWSSTVTNIPESHALKRDSAFREQRGVARFQTRPSVRNKRITLDVLEYLISREDSSRRTPFFFFFYDKPTIYSCRGGDKRRDVGRGGTRRRGISDRPPSSFDWSVLAMLEKSFNTLGFYGLPTVKES